MLFIRPPEQVQEGRDAVGVSFRYSLSCCPVRISNAPHRDRYESSAGALFLADGNQGSAANKSQPVPVIQQGTAASVRIVVVCHPASEFLG